MKFLYRGGIRVNKKILMVLILIIGLCVTCIFISFRTYERDYLGKLGLPPMVFTYDEMIAIKGEPNEIRERPDGGINTYYDGLTIIFSRSKVFTQAKVTGDAYRFGRKGLKVGDSRENVERACRWIRKIEHTPENVLGVIEKNGEEEVWVIYKFDENDCVSKIVLIVI